MTRWGHPSVGIVPTGDLFPMIGPERAMWLGRLVRTKALAAFSALRREGLDGVRLALNLSVNEVVREDTAREFAQQAEEAGLLLSDLEIEIPEEVLLDRVSNRALDELAGLRDRGAHLVIDNFGEGKSGVTQLLRLPLDGLKIATHFVQRLGIDRRAEEMVSTCVSLAQSRGHSVVAKGVETEQQAKMLLSLGCVGAQGYLFGYPMPLDDFRAWLARPTVDRYGLTGSRPDAPPLPQGAAARNST